MAKGINMDDRFGRLRQSTGATLQDVDEAQA